MGKNSPKKEVVKDKGQRIDISLTDRARAKGQKQSNPFVLPTPFPGVVPPSAPTMAQDDGWGNISAYTSAVSGDFGYGNGFFGYAYLADLAQRPEYRRMSEILAKEMTRKWIKFRATGDDAESKLDKIAKLEDAFRKYEVQDAFRRVAELDGFFGRAHLFIDTGASDDLLKTPLVLRPQTVKKGMLKSIRVVEPIWAYPDQYNSTQPLAPHYYKPQNWYVMSQGVHVTRLLTFVSREVPDILKPAYQFGGLSMSQMAYPYVENWLRARQSVSDLMHAFSVSGIKTNLQAPLSSAGGPSVLDRAQFFNDTRDNRGFMVLDKDSEDFFNITTPLSTLDKLQAQAQEQMSSVSGIPLVKLLGITPTGLNACLTAETLIETDRGMVPIAEVTTDDKVMTRDGLAPLAWSGETMHAEELIEIRTADSLIRCTANHPIFLPSINEFVPAESVQAGNLLLFRGAKKLTQNTANPSRGAVDGGGIAEGDITSQVNPVDSFFYTAKSMLLTMFQSLMDITSITLITTTQIISRAILSFFQHLNMPNIMAFQMVSLSTSAATTTKRAGIAAKTLLSQSQPDSNFAATGVDWRNGAQTENLRRNQNRFGPAKFAERISSAFAAMRNIVLENVQRQVKTALNTSKNTTKKIQKNGFVLTNKNNAETSYVVSVRRVKTNEPVYDLQVSKSFLPEFYANGVLVHNSSDGEIRVLYDYIEALQEQLFTKNLTAIMHVIMLSEFGEIDEEIVFTYEPLWTMSAQERAVIRKTDTDNGIELINAGVITPMEERTRQANSEDTLYPSLDLSIDPAEQMMTDEDTQIMPDPAKSRAAEARQENLFERTDAENV